MKTNVDYILNINLKHEIVLVKDVVVNVLEDCEIYLFGSIAKGKYKKESDIDILILTDLNKTKKELRVIRHNIEDIIDKLKISRDIDIKLYNKENYYILTENPCFEREILSDLIDIKEWNNG